LKLDEIPTQQITPKKVCGSFSFISDWWTNDLQGKK